MAVELLVDVSVRWECPGDIFYITEGGADGTRRTVAVPGPVLIALRPKIAAAVAEREKAHAGSVVVPIGRVKRGKH